MVSRPNRKTTFQLRADAPERRGLPVEELTHPAVIAAIVLLGINDWYLKTRFPGFLTWKLSDFAGIMFFPLLLTAMADTWLLVCNFFLRKAGRTLAFNDSLNRTKLLGCIAFTGVFFSLLKLFPACAGVFVSCMKAAGIHSRISADATDLVALVMLVPAYLVGSAVIGRAEIRRSEVLE